MTIILCVTNETIDFAGIRKWLECERGEGADEVG